MLHPTPASTRQRDGMLEVLAVLALFRAAYAATASPAGGLGAALFVIAAVSVLVNLIRDALRPSPATFLPPVTRR